uniref:Bm1448 n=1 Tax=Brugia malayi TaxID=6279 RepID=A0A1I9G3Y4_BRUMA|nr:Bm1448 [Brugia malayi]
MESCTQIPYGITSKKRMDRFLHHVLSLRIEWEKKTELKIWIRYLV